MRRSDRQWQRRAESAFALLPAIIMTHTASITPLRAAEADATQVERGLQDTERHFAPPDSAPQGPALDAVPQKGRMQETGTFLLSGVRVTGAPLLEPEILVPIYEAHVATEIDEQTILKIVDGITARLKIKGYPLSYARVPPQQIAAGILTIDIVAGRVGELNISGTSDPERYRTYFRELLESPVATKSLLERPILLVHDSPGVSVSDIALQEQEDHPGIYALSLALAEIPLSASIHAGNRGTRAAGPVQVGVSASYNDPFSINDQASVTYFTAPDTPRELQYLQGSYMVPVGTSGLTMKISSAYSAVDAGGSLGDVGTESSSFSSDVMLRYPIIRSRSLSLWMAAKADVRDSREDNDLGPVFDDRLVVLRGSVEFSAADAHGGQNYIFIEVAQGLSVAGTSKRGDSMLSRVDGGGSFTKISGEIYRRQELFSPELALVMRASGQKSTDALLSAEEFGLGGGLFGRAYQYGELTGDHGLAASIELDYSPELVVGPASAPTFYSFYDIGSVWNDGGLLEGRHSLASAGAGLRFRIGESMTFGFEVAKPLTKKVDEGDDRSLQYFFSVGANL